MRYTSGLAQVLVNNPLNDVAPTRLGRFTLADSGRLEFCDWMKSRLLRFTVRVRARRARTAQLPAATAGRRRHRGRDLDPEPTAPGEPWPGKQITIFDADLGRQTASLRTTHYQQALPVPGGRALVMADDRLMLMGQPG